MSRGGPGYQTNTTTVFMYNLKESFIGESAALSILNFVLIAIIVLIYLRISNWGRAEAHCCPGFGVRDRSDLTAACGRSPGWTARNPAGG
jgi:ABC-type Fe3+ transport system permease subunit